MQHWVRERGVHNGTHHETLYVHRPGSAPEQSAFPERRGYKQSTRLAWEGNEGHRSQATGVPPKVVDFLASLDGGNEVHIITAYGVAYAYDAPGLEIGFEAQCG